MKASNLGRHALCSCVVVAMLAGCEGSQPPIGTPGATPQAASQEAVTSQNPARGESNSEKSILYVGQVKVVTMLTYPGLKVLGRFSYPDRIEFGQGCPDDLTGNIYFPMASHYVRPGSGLVEYADGGTQLIGSLKPPSGDYAVNCAADPVTGDIAVVLGTQHDTGVVGIYAPGSRRPVTFEYPNMRWYASCRYDRIGNLFIEGETNKKTLFLELPKGGSKLIELSLHPKAVTLAWPLLWDGSNITIESLSLESGVLTIYRISVSGSKATVVGKTELRGAGGAAWIQDSNTVITRRCCKQDNSSYVAFYDYPAGGKPESIFKGLRNKHGSTKPTREVIGLTVATPPSMTEIQP
jgi:hypothetical protein